MTRFSIRRMPRLLAVGLVSICCLFSLPSVGSGEVVVDDPLPGDGAIDVPPNCNPDDGLTDECCNAVNPTLPAIPLVTMPNGKAICWNGCDPTSTASPLVTIAPPVPNPSLSCTAFTTTVTSGTLSASLNLYYTRNWTQAFPGLGAVQVYRFVAIGEASDLAPPCPAQQTHGAGPYFVYGFIDYAFKCPNGNNQQFKGAAVVLGHNCDGLIHDGTCSLTADPAGGHGQHAFVFVAPGSNFTPNPLLVPPPGPSTTASTTSGALRALEPGSCFPNEPFNSFAMANGPRFCPCSSGAAQYIRQSLSATTVCGGFAGTSSVCPYNTLSTPPLTLIAWSIGSWLTPGFPGLLGGNQAFLAEGGFDIGATDCPAQGPSGLEVFYGAETRWTQQCGGMRVDLASNQDPASGFALVGGPGESTRVLHVTISPVCSPP